MTKKLNEASVRLLLQSHMIGRIGCVHHGQPYIFPVNYIFDGTGIFCQSDEGVKLSILRGHKKICFQVDSVVSSAFWESVLVIGTFEELSGKPSEAAREMLYERIFPNHINALRQNGTPIEPGKIKKIMFRIEIDEITGRQLHPEAKIESAVPEDQAMQC